MRRTVFYSWQSDLTSSGNRSLIEDCLKEVVTAIAADESTQVEPVLDRDTARLPGTPDIASSILEKIALSDVLVADVSIIYSEATGRKSPKPNVVFELGYAASELGWDKLILVMNTAFGGPDLLPFDLRGRRTVVYDDRRGSTAEVRRDLQPRLEAALRAALTDHMQLDRPGWWGTWGRTTGAASGSLFIREVGTDSFLFDLEVVNGAHIGMMTAYARMTSKDVAFCRVPNGDDGEIGELLFRRSTTGDGRHLMAFKETADCSWWRGMRATFID